MGGYSAVRGGKSRVRQINSGGTLQRLQATHALKGHMIPTNKSRLSLQGIDAL
jgi:hypothetical protein